MTNLKNGAQYVAMKNNLNFILRFLLVVAFQFMLAFTEDPPFPKKTGFLIFEENFTAGEKGPLNQYEYSMRAKMLKAEGNYTLGLPKDFEVVDKGMGMTSEVESHVVWAAKTPQLNENHEGFAAHFWVEIHGAIKKIGGMSVGFFGSAKGGVTGKFQVGLTGFPVNSILSISGGPEHPAGLFVRGEKNKLLYSALPKMKGEALELPMVVSIILSHSGKAAVWVNLKKEWEGTTRFNYIESSELEDTNDATRVSGLTTTFLGDNKKVSDSGNEVSVIKAYRFEGLTEKEFESYIQTDELEK